VCQAHQHPGNLYKHSMLSDVCIPLVSATDLMC
jgi:hypothetical protein